jgi:hypothetical protein
MEQEKICEVDGCGFPTSECMIPDHPDLCGEHLEKWFLDKCKRIEQEQMHRGNHPDPVGV